MSVTYPVALVGLSALTAGGVGLAVETGHGNLAWVVIPVVGVLAGLFLYSYSKRPGPEPRRRAAPAAPPDDEPFEDPVELADRAAADPIFASSDPASIGPETPGSVAPPVPAGIPPGAPILDEPSPP